MRNRLAWLVIFWLVVAPLACGGPSEDDDWIDDNESDSESSVSWEPGEWGFNAEIEPEYFTAESPVTLRAMATMDDYDQEFSGTVAYRLAPKGDAPGAWQQMRFAGRGEYGDMIYEASISLPKGKVGIHFMIDRDNDGTHHELTDWYVEAE